MLRCLSRSKAVFRKIILSFRLLPLCRLKLPVVCHIKKQEPGASVTDLLHLADTELSGGGGGGGDDICVYGLQTSPMKADLMLKCN